MTNLHEYNKSYYLKNKDKRDSAVAAWNNKNKGRVRARRLAYKLNTRYGASLVWYLAQFEAQQGKCAVCRQLPGKQGLHVDHDHSTGKVRALLCERCNWIVGPSDERLSILNSAIDYILYHKNKAWDDSLRTI